MFKIPKQEYTAEFKDLAVKRVKSGEALSWMSAAPSSRRSRFPPAKPVP